MKNFTRKEMAQVLARELDMPVTSTAKIVDTFIRVLDDQLAFGRSIEFRNFGVLELVKRKPKIGRNPGNPKAGQYLIPARMAVRFRAGKDLFSRLNPE